MLEINIFSSLLIVSLFVILFFRKDNALPNKILAFILLVPALNFINNIHILYDGITSFPYTYFLAQVTAALFPPLTYYYILLMTGAPKPRSYKWLTSVSVLIVLYGIFIAIRFAFMDDAAQDHYMNSVASGPYPADMLIYSGVFFIHQLLYFSGNVVQIMRFKREMVQHVSNLSSVKIVYLFRFVVLLWSLTLITVILYVTIETVYVEYVFLPLVMVAVFFFILYYAFNQHTVFTHREYKEHLKKVVTVTPDTDTGEITNQTEDEKLFSGILQLIEDQQLYKQPDINVENLAEILDIPVYKVMQCIKNSGVTFYELIRRIRINNAKVILAGDGCNFTIEAIAYEVGFKSRASFYRAFKKYEDAEPSSLIKSKK